MNYLAEKSKKKELTEMQQIFLDNVVTTGGDLKKAAELAGYKGNHYQVIKSLKDELVDRPVPQASSKLQAAQTILDRVGVAKTERLNIDHNVSGGLFILPQKETVIVEGEYEER